jgi:hypothetical protein
VNLSRRTRIALAVAGVAGLIALALPDSSTEPLDASNLRSAAVALCGSYLPCNRGDPHFNEIARDYGGIGTTCGYLPAWMLWRLGCRDPRIVNRNEPADGLTYRPAMNIEDLVRGGQAIGSWRLYRLGNEPKGGDILYFQSSAFVSGTSDRPEEHVAICISCPPGGTGELVTYDLGHSSQPEGSLTKRTMTKGVVQFLGENKTLIGINDLTLIPMTAPADLTDHTKAGIA